MSADPRTLPGAPAGGSVKVPFDPDLRPRAHFTARCNWINDPNGLVFADGEYHLFFQHNAEGMVPERASWGHAVGTDLLSWTELSVAIPATDTEYALSGSVVVDRENASGLGTTGQPPMVALYTSLDPVTKIQSQSVAFSTDRGRTWTRYAANPVLDIGSTEFRDPKIIRTGDSWVMAVVMADRWKVRFYRSADLLHWDQVSEFGPLGSVDGVWECPDVVKVPIEGTSEAAWVLLLSVQSGGPAGGSGMQYVVGTFDGTRFDATGEARWLDYGADFYAAVSYTDAPGDAPIIQGWMSNWDYATAVPGGDFRGSMTLPRRLSLRPGEYGLRLVQRPIVAAADPIFRTDDLPVDGRLELPCVGIAMRLTAVFEPGEAQRVGVEVRVGPGERTRIVVDRAAQTVALDRTASGIVDVHPTFPAVHTAPLTDTELVRLDVYVDVASVEVLAADGAVALTAQVFPSPDSTGLAVFAEGGVARLRELIVTPL